jgi:hypothetical protein
MCCFGNNPLYMDFRPIKIMFCSVPTVIGQRLLARKHTRNTDCFIDVVYVLGITYLVYVWLVSHLPKEHHHYITNYIYVCKVRNSDWILVTHCQLEWITRGVGHAILTAYYRWCVVLYLHTNIAFILPFPHFDTYNDHRLIKMISLRLSL